MIDSPDPAGVTVILCARNEAAWIAHQLEALTRQNPRVSWEVIVVDNGSTDDTVAIARSFGDRLELRILNEATPGVARARNTGVAAARYPFIAHCDADDEVGEGWLAAIVDGLRRTPLVTGPLDEVGLNDPGNAWTPPRLPMDEAPVSNRFLPYAVGANIAYRREVHAALGGFDEEFPAAGGEDVDFSWSAQHAGYPLGFCNDAVVRYRRRDSLRGLAHQFFRYGAADALLFKRHARYGMQRSEFRQVLERWRDLLVDAPRALRDRRRRAEWLITASWSLGRIQGSIRHRALYL